MEAGQIFNGYILDKQLGRGGMAEVWAAREGEKNQAVALKILLTEFVNNAAVKDRFEREARLTLLSGAR